MNQQFEKLIKEIDKLYLHIVDPDKFMKMRDELTDLVHHQIDLLNALNAIVKRRKDLPGFSYNHAEYWYDEILDRAETLAISLKAKKEIDQIIKAFKHHSSKEAI